MSKYVVILCALDTKGKEADFLKELIKSKGMSTILIDTGFGAEATIPSDIPAEEVARAGGWDIKEMRASRDTGKITSIMTEGAKIKVWELLNKSQCDGIISFGGVSNTTLATNVMKALPFGIPKFMVSSAASMPTYAAAFIGTKDITMMHSVVDISGINDLTRAVLERAAGGICGMVAASGGAVKPVSDLPLIAVTTFKFCEECSQLVMEGLTKKGYAVILFHAQGMGDRSMEELIDQHLFQGVVDVVPAGVSEQLFGGNRAAGSNRLEAAGRTGIPLVIAPSGFDMISCGPLSRKDSGDRLWAERKLANRKIFIPDELRVEARTSKGELEEIATVVADKLNRSKGPVKFFIPARGWSNLSVKGANLYEPEIDAIFAPELRKKLKDDIEVIEKDMELNSSEFAEVLVNSLDEMIKDRKT